MSIASTTMTSVATSSNAGGWIQIATLIVLSLTLMAICWYSWEARELRKWQKRQALLSIIHMQMEKVISEHANGPDRSPGFHLAPWIKAQRDIFDGKRDDLEDLINS